MEGDKLTQGELIRECKASKERRRLVYLSNKKRGWKARIFFLNCICLCKWVIIQMKFLDSCQRGQNSINYLAEFIILREIIF
jgi:hypothetical protein